MSGDENAISGYNTTTPTLINSAPEVASSSAQTYGAFDERILGVVSPFSAPPQPPHIYRFTRADFVSADSGSIRISPGLRAFLIAMIVAVIGAAISFVLYSSRRSRSVAPSEKHPMEGVHVTEDEEMGGGEETSSSTHGVATTTAAIDESGAAEQNTERVNEKDVDLENCGSTMRMREEELDDTRSG